MIVFQNQGFCFVIDSRTENGYPIIFGEQRIDYFYNTAIRLAFPVLIAGKIRESVRKIDLWTGRIFEWIESESDIPNSEV